MLIPALVIQILGFVSFSIHLFESLILILNLIRLSLFLFFVSLFIFSSSIRIGRQRAGGPHTTMTAKKHEGRNEEERKTKKQRADGKRSRKR